MRIGPIYGRSVESYGLIMGSDGYLSPSGSWSLLSSGSPNDGRRPHFHTVVRGATKTTTMLQNLFEQRFGPSARIAVGRPLKHLIAWSLVLGRPDIATRLSTFARSSND